jgi:RNA polymerase sigma-70 factor (family 1)
VKPLPEYTDEELVVALRNGDKTAFEVIYRRYVKDLYRFARSRVPNEEAEEIVHDVFESLWSRKEKLKIESLKHYLFTSTRYMVIRYFSHATVKKKYAEHYRLFEMAYETMDPEQPRDPESIRTILLQNIGGLPERCQEAIRLRIRENLSNGEIASRMNINKRTVEVYIFRAFIHLRASYGKIFKPS